jgi:non-canonical (house-cleaning) NTP pyrophosphatase
VELINEGKELNEADDIVSVRTNSKQTNGAVGVLTNDIEPRVLSDRFLFIPYVAIQ